MKHARFGLVVCLLVGACAADLGGDDPGPPPEQVLDIPRTHPGPRPLLQCSGIQPGPSPIRRLTRTEYNNTVRDLLGDDTQPASAFVREEERNGFNNNADVLGVTPILAEQLMRASEGVARRATERLPALVPCTGDSPTETACVRDFIRSFGERAFRGPLDDADVDRLAAVFTAGRAEGFRTGIELLLQTILQSSRFMYRVEFGATDAGQAAVPLTSWEMAARLSYLFWNSMPDDALFAAAKAGKLATKEQIKEQAVRLLADPKTRKAVATFHAQWLGLDELATATKSAKVFPTWNDSIRAAMRAETDMFLDNAIWQGGGSLRTLLAAPCSFMNPELARFYGVRPPSGNSFQRVDLDPAERLGILTQASLLAINAHSDQSSPVTRGKFIREQFFCTTPPPPPPNVMAVAPDLDPNLTTRERFAAHARQASCAGCHKLMDPIGLGFENYDGVGNYRKIESGKLIDVSGAIVDSDVNGSFEGVPELVERLLESQQVRDCVVTQWFRFGYGRSETAQDACSLRGLEEQFDAPSATIQSLLLSLTQTDTFLYRPAVISTGGTP